VRYSETTAFTPKRNDFHHEGFMNFPRSILAVMASLFALPLALHATQASCTFTTFPAPSGYLLAQVNGVADDGTVVGQLENKNTGDLVAFARAANGGVKVYKAPQSRITWFTQRAGGVNVGSYLDNNNLPHVHGFLLQGTNFAALNYPKAVNTWLYGINQLGSVVGSFNISSVVKGYKLESGKYTVIRYGSALATRPQAISDDGVVVGSYFDGILNHGFVWLNGTFKTIDSPNAPYGTILTGVNRSGLIVGNRLTADRTFGFIYRNNAFANIVYAGAKFTTAGGINNAGVISGEIFFTASNILGYTAVCK
jgi:uncharacterized membrane protein